MAPRALLATFQAQLSEEFQKSFSPLDYPARGVEDRIVTLRTCTASGGG